MPILKVIPEKAWVTVNNKRIMEWQPPKGWLFHSTNQTVDNKASIEQIANYLRTITYQCRDEDGNCLVPC